jgi:hypothetical protein
MTEVGWDGWPTNDESPPSQRKTKMKAMSENNPHLQKLTEEFVKFQTTMEELYLLKRVAADLKSYRRMIKVKRYD